MKLVRCLLFCFLSTAAFGQAVTADSDNAALTELFHVDQAARQGKNIDWAKLRDEDETRRQTVHAMLDAGQVHTATDYFHASLVYQHGQKPDDYLLAHVLAVTAINLGSKEARWLAAATLDRYLDSTGKPQIYGTQFSALPGQPFTQMPMNAALVSDSMRAASCVVSETEQKKMVEDLKHGGALRGTSIHPCR
jgi:hypothetical protein